MSTNLIISDLGWGYDNADQVNAFSLAHLGLTCTPGQNFRDELNAYSTTGNGSGHRW